jgi:hypothetical protein
MSAGPLEGARPVGWLVSCDDGGEATREMVELHDLEGIRSSTNTKIVRRGGKGGY